MKIASIAISFMNRSIRLLLFFSFVVPSLGGAQTLIRLFNQNDLKGWYAYEPASGRHADASRLFSTDQHLIRMFGNKVGYLMSNKSFHDFRLTVEFRWNTDTTFIRKSETRNSGVMYCVPEEVPDTLWPQGIQFQIKENATGDFVLLQGATLRANGKRTEPGKSVTVKRLSNAERPVGEWNSLVVISVRDTIRQILNGVLVNEGAEPSVKAGRILLQYEGYPIDFRKVEVDPL